MSDKVVFLDRDGTINVDHGFVHHVSDFQFIDGAVAAIKALREAGFLVAVVTNQSGVGRGLYSLADIHAVHDHLRAELTKFETRVDAIAYCPHSPDDQCDCRKPRTGMFDQVARELAIEIDRQESWMVGDRSTDIEFGHALGLRTALIRGPLCESSELPGPSDLSGPPELIGDSLHSLVTEIVSRMNSD